MVMERGELGGEAKGLPAEGKTRSRCCSADGSGETQGAGCDPKSLKTLDSSRQVGSAAPRDSRVAHCGEGPFPSLQVAHLRGLSFSLPLSYKLCGRGTIRARLGLRELSSCLSH